MKKKIRLLLRKGVAAVPMLLCGLLILNLHSNWDPSSLPSSRSKTGIFTRQHTTTDISGKTLLRDHHLMTSVPRQTKNSTSKFKNLSCARLKYLLNEAKKNPRQLFRQENMYGNRGIYFSELDDEGIKIVIKVATMTNNSSQNQRYRYHSARRELENLRILNALKFRGSPKIYGVCDDGQQVIYAVTRFFGSHEFCKGSGTDVRCALAQDVITLLRNSKDSGTEVLRFLEKVTCFFSQFEEHNMLLEDFSGANFHISPVTWDLFLVDADSVIFYENSPLYSRMTCHNDNDCPKPSGSLWPANSLNQRIYSGCGEMYGNCINSTCRGLGSSLHTCGVGRWLIKSMRSIVPTQVYNEYKHLLECTTETLHDHRCTMAHACVQAGAMLRTYLML